MAIRILVVDDHELIRLGLRSAFARDGDFDVIGEAGTLNEATRLLGLLAPQVVIFDVRLPDGSGIEAARMARGQFPDLGIVILTSYVGDHYLFDALEAGASAFVPKNAPADEVVAAARHAACSPRAFAATDLAEAMKRKLSPAGPQVSPREREVLQLLANGLSVAQISHELYISDSTTKTHISKLYEKLGATNRAQALMSALRLGLLSQSEQQF